ncbi:MAG: hypothetical protein ACRDP7_47080 [Trebonia sp.]
MNGEMSCEQVRELAPELTIGIADGQQRDAALRHAATCPDCRRLISELSSVVDDLLLLAPSHEPPLGFAARTVAGISPPAAVPEGMRDPAPSPARRARQPGRALARPGTRLRWAAAAACLAAASVGGGLWLSSGAGGPQAGAATLTGTNPATHVSATAILTATSWGTSIQLQVRGLPENVECRLVIRSRGGGTEVSGAWDAWQEGPLSIPASASWLPSDIASLQVTTPTRSLVTISVTHPTAGAGR